jgi:hypothetical protein
MNLYRQRRDSWTGFTSLIDAITHDDADKGGELIHHSEHMKREAKWRPAERDGDKYADRQIKDFELHYPVGLGFNETHPHTLLEFAFQWKAVNVVHLLKPDGAKPTTGAVWCAIQVGSRELFEAMRTSSPLRGDDELQAITFAIRWWRADILERLLHSCPVQLDCHLYGLLLANALMTERRWRLASS